MSHQLREKWLLGKNYKNEDEGKITRWGNWGNILQNIMLGGMAAGEKNKN